MGFNPLASETGWLLGQVLDFYPDTHSYLVQADGHFFDGIQRLLDHPGDVTGLPAGTMVALHKQLGEWVIAGILSRGAGSRPELAPVRITEVRGTGADSAYAPRAGTGDARSHEAPQDVNAGDWARSGGDG